MFTHKWITFKSRLAFSNSLISFVNMDRPLKLFRFSQKLYQRIGIYPPQSNQNHSFNSKNVFFICVMAHIVSFVGAFFLFKAKRLDEYALSFYFAVSAVSTIFYYITNIYQIDNILKLIEKFEEFIGKSEPKFAGLGYF